ncbi:hypothetical protein ASwh1_328 [Aeromonas phage Aswh_1]|nr:hypothetical protein ASwh1_328 [Aeromonas phage Aswh_1]
MSNIQSRYRRVMDWLETQLIENPEDIKIAIKYDSVNLMVLRNATNLWVDYEENTDYILDGVNHDPNHPDNLSAIVWNNFRSKHL